MSILNISRRYKQQQVASWTPLPVPLFKVSLSFSSHLSIVAQEESSIVWSSAAVKYMLKEQFTEEDAFLPAYSRK